MVRILYGLFLRTYFKPSLAEISIWWCSYLVIFFMYGMAMYCTFCVLILISSKFNLDFSKFFISFSKNFTWNVFFIRSSFFLTNSFSDNMSTFNYYKVLLWWRGISFDALVILPYLVVYYISLVFICLLINCLI